MRCISLTNRRPYELRTEGLENVTMDSFYKEIRRGALGLAAVFFGAACSSPSSPRSAKGTPHVAEPAIIAQVGGEAATIYRTRCATCHGISGLGNGAAAKPLPVKPRSFKDDSWRKSVTDKHIHTVIVEGGSAVGKSPLMSSNYDLRGRADVLDGLVKIIRGL